MKNRFTQIVIFLLCLTPALVLGQQTPWKHTIIVKDIRKDGPVDVAEVTVTARWMTDKLKQGTPIFVIPGTTKPEPIMYSNKEKESFLKFKIEDIKITDKVFNESPESQKAYKSEYKVIMRSLWADVSPRPYDENERDIKGMDEAQRRKKYITSPNMEYEFGDPLPPPIIFKIDRNNNYVFKLMFTAITPETQKEVPDPTYLPFLIDGLERDGKGFKVAPVKEPEVIKVVPEKVVVKKDSVVKDNTAEIDAAVKKAIADQDVETLKRLINEHPKVQSVIDAKKYLALGMRKEWIDSLTCQVDVYYKRWPNKLLSSQDVITSMTHEGARFDMGNRMYWRDGKLFVLPPYDKTTYVLTAEHRVARENRDSTRLNSFKDYINFTYKNDREDEAVAFTITGGKGPYSLHIQKVTDGVIFDFENSMKIFGDTVISKDKIARAMRLKEEGEYRFFVEDTEQLKKTGRNTVHIVPPPAIPPIVWYAGLGIAFLGFIGFLFYRREQRRKDEEMEKLLASRGGKDPRVKRKPRPDLKEFWKETAISELSLHKNFIREVGMYLKERPRRRMETSSVEGVILGTVLKFDFETEQYEVRLDRFRAMDATPLNIYDGKPGVERWPAMREIAADHKDLVRIGWLQVVDGGQMTLSPLDINFTDEQFSELFQLCLKIDISGAERHCCFFTRTISGKVNNSKDRLPGVDYWLDWDKLEDAGYYEASVIGEAPSDPNGDPKSKSKAVIGSNPKSA